MRPARTKSRGCKACKTKRVKCDLGAPCCLRCLRSRLICPGYPVESELIFRDMNDIAKAKVIKSRAKAGSTREDAQALLLSASFDSGSSAAGSQGSSYDSLPDIHMAFDKVLPSMSTKWERVAVSRFFVDYVFPSPIAQRTDLQFLLKLCSSFRLCPSLKEALQAVALLSLANQLRLEWLAVEANKAYCRSLPLVAELLENVEEAKDDTTLATIFLFTIYEMIGGVRSSGTVWESHHHRGRLSLLRLRGEGQLKTPTERNLFWVNYTHITLKCITHHLKPAEEACTWLDCLDSDETSPKLAKCKLRTAWLCYEAQTLFDSNAQDPWWVLGLLEVIKEAILIDLEYQNWSDSASGTYLPKFKRSCSSSTQSAWKGESSKDFQTYPQQIYHDIYVAAAWNTCRGLRIHLNEIILHCDTLLELHQYTQDSSFNSKLIRERSSSIISELVSDICASVPFCLGVVDSTGTSVTIETGKPINGYLMYWPVYVAMVSAGQGSEKQAWLREQLEYISDSMGIRLASLVAHRNSTDPWDLRSMKGVQF